MTMPDGGGSGDGHLQGSILLELGKLSTSVAVIDTKLTDLMIDRADHEGRLRSLERQQPSRAAWVRDALLLLPIYGLVVDLILRTH